jgi:hypothetical protein
MIIYRPFMAQDKSVDSWTDRTVVMFTLHITLQQLEKMLQVKGRWLHCLMVLVQPFI